MSNDTSLPVETQEILARLRPHLPGCLQKIEHSGLGLRFVFAPFTGAEPAPEVPSSFRADPGLTYVRESEDAAEHRLRQRAEVIITDLYDEARRQWRDAAYVRDLREVIGDAPALWAAYQREATVLATAEAYLRTPEAAHEWPSAIARLVDAQDSTLAAARAFDRRGQDIAEVQDRHLYADLRHSEALIRAGHPEAKNWHIASFSGYGVCSRSEGDEPLAEAVRRRIERQEAHLAKVARLSASVASVPGPRRAG
ncbi:hypothetical protein ACFVFF_38795 [Streptomyces sp. NPDC057680]|uniref:hypothetical protein n=1 Tax=Streptomyces sp. NPDC057680 TaxID=3346208 RepID=UPI00368A8AC7